MGNVSNINCRENRNTYFVFCNFFENHTVYEIMWENNTWCVQVLRSPKEAFAAAMQSWREGCEKCVCLQGDYVEK